MKKLFLLACVLAAMVSRAQNEPDQPKRMGYIGITFGPSFPLGNFAEQTPDTQTTGLTGTETTASGLSISLVDFGYLFSDHVGITAKWFGSAWARNTQRNYPMDPWSCGGIMAGPMFSFPIATKMDFDLRPMIGYAICVGQRQSGTPVESDASMGLAYEIGGTFRIHTGERFSLIFPIGYFHTLAKFYDSSFMPPEFEQPFSTFSLNMGVAYRLR
jgi:hypothetical protein